MAGARTLGIAMLVLAAAIATPTLSAAQDPAVPVEPAAPTASPPPAPPLQADPPSAQEPGKEPEKEPEPSKDPAQSQPAPPQPVQEQAAPRSSGPQATVAASASISVGDNFFSPASVTVAVGDTISWRNTGQAQHSATANDGSFDTGVFGPGQTRSNTFRTAGTFSYFCTVHGQAQSGTVRVLAAGGGGGGRGGGGGGGNQSEAAAVAAPDAAGSSTMLPATGFAAGGLAFVGFLLLAGGHLVKRLERDDEERGRLFSIY